MVYEMLRILGASFLIGLTGALAPGPTLVATINTSLKTGWTAGPKVAAGHALVEMLVFLLIVQGLATAMQQYSRLIAVLGGLALMAFGFLMVKGSRNAALVSSAEDSITNPFMAGVLTSAANPYFWIWWLSIGSALIISGLEGGIILAGLFMIGHWGADFGWYTLISTSVERGKKILSEANYRNILALCGCFLIVFGTYYLINA